MRFPPEIERMMLEMQVEGLERQRAAVLADPLKHKLTLHFPEGARLNWLYFKVAKSAWPEVRYCYSTERNLAGYFLGWRETINRDGSGKRDQWVASKRRKTVADKARSRSTAHNRRVKAKPVKPLEERRTTYWISESGTGPGAGQSWSRGLGKIVTEGGPNNALDEARIRWPDAGGELTAVHIGRKK
jgi:hypothetical protein